MGDRESPVADDKYYTCIDVAQSKRTKYIVLNKCFAWLSSAARMLIINASLNCLDHLSVILQEMG